MSKCNSETISVLSPCPSPIKWGEQGEKDRWRGMEIRESREGKGIRERRSVRGGTGVWEGRRGRTISFLKKILCTGLTEVHELSL
jgi:hypothetical protein